MEDPPEGLELVDEDTRLLKLNEWSKNLHSLAHACCLHGEGGRDSRGHERRPCAECVKTVRHVTEYWFMALHIKAKAVADRAAKDKLELPMVNLREALFIASATLDPAVSVSLPEWGAA
jgi:hypothetical protein